MKHGANRLVEHLLKHGITAMAIHGNKSQTARTKALADFKKGELQVLVATDIAARGIDIDQLPHVVNFELPNVPEDYVHRIGRTGRAGSPGEAISLVSVDENGFLRDIERLIKHDIAKEIIPGFAPPAHERPEPIVLGRMVIGEGAGRGGARPRRDGPGRGDSGRSSHGAPRGNGGSGAGRGHSGITSRGNGGGAGSGSSANANGHRGGASGNAGRSGNGNADRSGGGSADRGGNAPRRDDARSSGTAPRSNPTKR
jgi:ATP-dependent RNA helicase RhlE